MASDIDNTSIDETYPVAGKDNDSKGFRDNFQTIKNNFTAAKNEITALQNNTAKKNAANDFNWNVIQQATFSECGEVLYNGTSVGSATDSTLLVQYANGPLQKFELAGNVTFSLSIDPTAGGFPASGTVAKMRMHLTGNGNTHAAKFSIYGGTGIIKTNERTKAFLSSVTCTSVDSGTDYITCSGNATTNLRENMPVVFSGVNVGGSLVAGTVYYVKVINNSTTFSVSETISGGIAGSVKQLTSGSVTMTATMLVGVKSTADPVVIDFWTYDNGATVFMDYVGTFS